MQFDLLHFSVGDPSTDHVFPSILHGEFRNAEDISDSQCTGRVRATVMASTLWTPSAVPPAELRHV